MERQFTAVYLALTFLAIAAGATVNLWGSYIEIRADHRVAAEVAGHLHRGKHVAFEGNLEDRYFQIEYVRQAERTPEVIVFGSSRSLQVRAASAGAASFFNHSAWGSIVIDYLGIFDLYEKRGHLPAKVIIGVDPWIFNRNSDQIRWWPLTGEAVDMAAILRASGSPGDATRFYGWLAGMLGEVAAQRLPGILSHEQLRLTLRRLRGADAVGVRSRAYHALDDEDSDLWVKRPDGSIRYRKEERDKTLAALREEAAAFAAAVPAYSLRDFHELDPVARTYFESFVRYLLRRGIRVVFFLSPLHPDAYPGVAARHENRMLIETERYVHELGDVLAIPVVGTYDGRNSGCTETQFIDAHHPDQACVEIMFRAAGRDR